MATNAPAQIAWLADEWEKLYPSATISGIIGDKAHAARGGYHISIQDQPSDNYSVTRKDDKAPPGDWPRNMASAIDMTLSLADMKVCHGRLRAAFLSRSTDSRMKYINAWNGWNGEGSPGRYDVVTGTISTASDDHKWHVHLEVRRRYVNDRKAMEAILSILKGETEAQYLGEDDVTKSEFMAWMTEWAKSAEGRDAVAVAVWNYLLTAPAGSKDEDGKWRAISFLTNIYPASVSARDYAAEGRTTGAATLDAVKSLASAVGAADVDEVALANAMAANANFVSALATAIAAKVQSGQNVTAAVKAALNDAKIVVA